MEEFQEVEMTGERGDAVIDIDATDPITEISKEENNIETTEIEKIVQQRLATVPGVPFEIRVYAIPRLPARFHEADKTYYQPALVSIGPYHHGKEELRGMEEHKWSTLRDFIARNDQVGFGDYFKEIRALEQKARRYYSEIARMTSDEFVMMLVLDGCFILEYLMKLEHSQHDAFIFLTGWGCSVVPTDMLLLENQIPLFIIHKLFNISVVGGKDCNGHDCPLLKLIFKWLIKDTTSPAYIQAKLPQEPCDTLIHLLHFCHACMVPVSDLKMEENNLVTNQSLSLEIETFSRLKSWFRRQPNKTKEEDSDEGKTSKEEEGAGENITKEENQSTEQKKAKEEESAAKRHIPIVIPCVSELSEAGVTFKRKREPRHMFDISFKNGIMEMPPMATDTTRKIIFSNIAAFEQSLLYMVSGTFTSYLALMDALINTEKDVAVLQQCGILENLLENEVHAAANYNHFGDFNVMDYENHHFRDLFVKVRNYSDSTWHKYRARLNRDYFKNPWTTTSVVAGGALLILTAVQTGFTIYSTFQH